MVICIGSPTKRQRPLQPTNEKPEKSSPPRLGVIHWKQIALDGAFVTHLATLVPSLYRNRWPTRSASIENTQKVLDVSLSHTHPPSTIRVISVTFTSSAPLFPVRYKLEPMEAEQAAHGYYQLSPAASFP